MLPDLTELPTVRVPARAALAGNPSDGHQGAVVSTIVPACRVTATAIAATDNAAESPLVAAARERFGREIAAVDHVGVTVDSNIPQSVGLAGSSAIVIAAIRLFALASSVTLHPSRIAAMCHAVERDDLGIAGGWQDEISQAHASEPGAATTRFMDFSVPITHRPISPAGRTIPLYLAYEPGAAQSSDVPHSNLAQRADDAAVTSAMQELAAEAWRAANAIESGDVHALKQTMNASFDLRSSVMPIEPAHQRMIDVARGAGAAANFAGSGGAVIGVVPKDEANFVDVLEAAGLTVITWNLDPLRPGSGTERNSRHD